jgi:hypothetical protein
MGTQDWRSWLNGGFREKVLSAGPPKFPPDLFGHAATLNARPKCWAVSTYEMGQDRGIRPNGTLPAQEGDLLDLEVRDDGGLRLFCGRASYLADSRSVTFINLIVTLTRRVVRAAAAVAAKTDFLGEWSFGIAIRGIGQSSPGLPGMELVRVRDYDEVATCSAEEVQGAPDEIVRLLLASFCRGLGIFDRIPGLA